MAEAKSDAVAQRAYTVSEIDSMREALRSSIGHNVTPVGLEDTLRTYMVGGVDPAELVKEVEEKLAEELRKKQEAKDRIKATARATLERYDLQATFKGEPFNQFSKTLLQWEAEHGTPYPHHYLMSGF
jgi:hypothetical protein